MLRELIELLEKVYEEAKAHKEHENNRRNEFLKVASKAVRQTLAYIGHIGRDENKRDLRTEEKLSDLWAKVALAAQSFDSDLAERCYLKGNYWANPDNWGDEEVKNDRIEIERIGAEIGKYFKGEAKAKKPKQQRVGEQTAKLSNDDHLNPNVSDKELGQGTIRTQKPWYKKMWAIILAIASVLVLFTTLVINYYEIKEKHFDKKSQSTKVTEPNQVGKDKPSIELISGIQLKGLDERLTDLRTSKNLRKLVPLETGRSISETPVGTYFFLPSGYLSFSDGNFKEILNRAPVNSYLKSRFYYFEIHKRTDGQIVLLGYVGDEIGAALSNAAISNRKEIVLFSEPVKNFQNLAMIPINRIFKSNSREISDQELGDIKVLDLLIE